MNNDKNPYFSYGEPIKMSSLRYPVSLLSDLRKEAKKIGVSMTLLIAFRCGWRPDPSNYEAWQYLDKKFGSGEDFPVE